MEATNFFRELPEIVASITEYIEPKLQVGPDEIVLGTVSRHETKALYTLRAQYKHAELITQSQKLREAATDVLSGTNEFEAITKAIYSSGVAEEQHERASICNRLFRFSLKEELGLFGKDCDIREGWQVVLSPEEDDDDDEDEDE